MNSQYSIKDLERLSGIKAHTIRIWEQRYNIIVPKRTKTNIRYYEDSDLRKILNVSFLVHHGVKISKVASLTDEEMCEKVKEQAKFSGDYAAETNDLKVAMFEFNQQAFDQAFSRCIDKYGEEETFTNVLGAFLEQLGILWQTETVSVSHEHFVSNLVKQKLYAAIDRVNVSTKKNAKTYLLYLPSNELHEIGLLHIQYFLKKRGERVIFLGQNTPSDYLVDVYKKTPYDELIGVFTTSPNCDEIPDYLDNLKSKFNGYKIKCRFSGAQLYKVIEQGFNDNRISLFKNLNELREDLISSS